MFFDTDDAKLNRCETLATDLPPADIPNSPNDKVKFPIVNSLLVDKLSESLNNSVEYQSGDVSPSPKSRRLDDKSIASTLLLNDLSGKTNTTPCDSPDSNLETSFDDSKKLCNEPTPIDSVTPPCDITNSQNEGDNNHKDASKSHIDEDEINLPCSQVNSEIPQTESHIYEDEIIVPCSQDDEGTDIEKDVKCPDIQITTETPTDDSKSSEPASLEPVHNADTTHEESVEIVEAINENVTIPPIRPKRRFRSPQAAPRKSTHKGSKEEYPEHLNPFGDDDDDVSVAASPMKPQTSTNPFGSDSDEEDSTVVTSTPITSPMKAPGRYTPSASPLSDSRSSHLPPMKKAPSLNPFGDSDDEDNDSSAIPVPLPRSSQVYPEPMPFPRSALRASLRSIDSAVSTSSRKKRPAPPPPTPPSPASTIRSIRSRKTRRAPLPPGMTSSRLSLASDNISLYEDSRDPDNVPEQISAVADRITEWVETSQIDTSINISNSKTVEDVSERLTDSAIASTPSKDTSLTDVDASKTSESIHRKSPVLQLIENEPTIEDRTEDVKDDPLNESTDNKEHSVIDSELSNEPKLRTDEIEIENENFKDKGHNVDEAVILKSEMINTPDNSIQNCPPLEPYVAVTDRDKTGMSETDYDDRLSNDKKNKNDLNMTRKISGGSTGSGNIGGYSLHKSAHGQWRRKKAPAPPLPLNPEQRQIKKDFPIVRIKQELNDIEIKQQGLERQGVELEARIRAKFDGDASITPYVEDLVLQLFELVNEKNELFRKQAELMYLRRQQHLEEEHAELEKEIRELMSQPEVNKTDSDKELEEQLIQRLVEVVERRDAIVQCLEMDRIREAEEDRSISAQLNVFTKAMAPDEKLPTSPKKNKSSPDRHKKKWYTLSRSPKKSPS